MASAVIRIQLWCPSSSLWEAQRGWGIFETTHWRTGNDSFRRCLSPIPRRIHTGKDGQETLGVHFYWLGRWERFDNGSTRERLHQRETSEVHCGTTSGTPKDEIRRVHNTGIHLLTNERRVMSQSYDASWNEWIKNLRRQQQALSLTIAYRRLPTESGAGIAQRAHFPSGPLFSNCCTPE